MELDLTRIFVKVIQNGSFSRGAEILKMPKSTVSKAITRLEKETGTKLLLRTTRSLTLTAAGRMFYEASLGPVTQLEDAQKSLYGQDSILTGLIRITAPEDLGSTVIAPAIAELSNRHPDLCFELVYTDEVIDLVKDGFDLAVRIGKISDSGLKLKRSGEVVLIAVASPGFLKNKKITSPNDLENLPCLTFNVSRFNQHWTLKTNKKTVNIAVKPKIMSNQMTSLIQCALEGAGIALVPSHLCASHLAKGHLVRLLPDWSGAPFPVSLVTPLAPSSSVRLKMTVDHIHTALQKALGKDS